MILAFKVRLVTTQRLHFDPIMGVSRRALGCV